METIVLPGRTRPVGTGWLPDRPDVRDLTSRSTPVLDKLKNSSSASLRGLADRMTTAGGGRATNKLPPKADLRQWCSSVEDQGELGSCTANAACGIMEYYQRRASGKYIDLSRLFLYKVTRDFLGVKGDTGAYLRSVMGALAAFGSPPEKYWPYDVAKFDDDPPAFAFAFAQNYQALQYFRLDPAGTNGEDTLAEVRSHLAAGIPAMFGFTVYESIQKPASPGDIPFPSAKENVLGGHAIAAVGYDDKRKVTNPGDNTTQTGAFLIRNSWGDSWGDGGYGWLPYEYVRRELATDWWSMTQAEMFDTTAFDE
ncbi:Cysteine protease, C1A family [Actinopolymorpha cephalotaxi]|uniref:C1A family cysteine protease n=1 Tax=Actinopolymorpha cephalotaxi TaxID=504797 RepID=A0A1I2RJU8_9ACTN|nr:C1 family peptidase [Actinopolymorpha cephalotaxi]NYH82281.1 C1A family cysteine protease [Actinopolymorpha cephalotaxi]SFG38046.1 Cysteine protease, C1A family [Actinopolymorpha cephalotaxi]